MINGFLGAKSFLFNLLLGTKIICVCVVNCNRAVTEQMKIITGDL